jgi:hypothetical protein
MAKATTIIRQPSQGRVVVPTAHATSHFVGAKVLPAVVTAAHATTAHPNVFQTHVVDPLAAHAILYGAAPAKKAPAHHVPPPVVVPGTAPTTGGGASYGPAPGVSEPSSMAIPPTMPSLSPQAIAASQNPNVTSAPPLPQAPLALPQQTSVLVVPAKAVRPWWVYAIGLGALALVGWWLFLREPAPKSNPRRFRRRNPKRRARARRRNPEAPLSSDVARRASATEGAL